ncbi:MAG: hypothetical protein MN733_12065 [Nitrososphaera sp.]|nr:hypothetical protein [Nitrososphaera sp.]
MANSNTPFGLRPVRMMNGSPWCGEANLYVVLAADTSDYFIGDAVMLGGSASIQGVPSVIKYAAGGSGATAPVGVIVGILPVSARPTSLVGSSLSLEDKFLPGTSTIDRFVLVVDSTDVIFEVQADSVGLPLNSVGSNVDLTVAAPSNTNQLSATVLLNTSDAATATLPYKIIGFSSKPENEINATATTDEPFVVTLVRPNEHAFKVGTIGLAV